MNQLNTSPHPPKRHRHVDTPSHSALDVVREILAASRPVSWANTAIPFMAAFLTSGGQINAFFILSTIFFLLPYNLLMYGVNDIFDYESDIKNPRKGGLEGSLVAPDRRRMFWIAIILILIISLGALWPLTSVLGRWTLGALIALALSYSVKGLRFKEIPILDSINSACHFVGPAVFGWLVSPKGEVAWMVAVAFFAWGMASHALGAIQDIKPDRAGKIRSIATMWGARKTLRFSFVLYVLSCILTALIAWPVSLAAAFLLLPYVLNAAFFLKYTSDAQSKLFRRAWTNFLWLNGFVGFWLTQLLLYVFDPLQLGPSRIDNILLFCLCFSILQFALIGYNLTAFRRPTTKRLEEWPRMSILIHSYNQADNIASTILASLGQDYPDFEILLTDLGSDDNTVSIADSYSDKRFKRVSIAPIEAGWSVNAWASDQLLKKATGEYAVLVSADTVLLPNALAQIASLMEEKHVHFLSLLPSDQNKSLAQKTILSHNQYLLLSAYPAAYLQAHAPERSSAQGGITAFAVHPIREIGGFSEVRASPLEDQELFRRARNLGLKAQLYRASDLATSQNHQGIQAILEDDIQRYYPALNYHFPIVWFLTLGGLFVFTLPSLILIWDILSGQNIHALLAVIVIVAHLITRWIVALETRQNLPAQVLAPFTNVFIMGVLIASMLHYELFKPRWQTRTELVV